MKKIAAFIDESGDPRFTIGATKSLVFSCVILDSDKIESINIELLSIQKKLGITEFKSANIRSDERRIEILKSIIPLDLKYLILIIDKESILGEWRLYPKSFYKYTQKLLHRELHRLFAGIHISVDKFGTPEYQKSFKEYIEREVQLDLFESYLTISSAKDNIIIQIADLLAGTWRKIEEKAVADIATIKELIGIQNIYIFRWPDNYSQLYLENITNEHDREIASICIECAENYLRLNNDAMGTHAHNAETGCKLDISNGKLYNKTTLAGSISRKNLLTFRSKVLHTKLPKLTI